MCRRVLAVLVFLLAFPTSNAFSQQHSSLDQFFQRMFTTATGDTIRVYLQPRVLVRFSDAANEHAAEQAVLALGLRDVKTLGHRKYRSFSVPVNGSQNAIEAIQRAVDRIRGMGVVDAVSPDYLWVVPHSALCIDGPYTPTMTGILTYANQWNLHSSEDWGVDAESVWNISTGAGQTIAVLDAGVVPNHSNIDFAPYAWDSVDHAPYLSVGQSQVDTVEVKETYGRTTLQQAETIEIKGSSAE